MHPLRLDTASDEDGVRRSAGALLLRNVASLRYREYYLTHIAFTHMIITKNGRQMEVPYAPPVTLANHYLAREGMWRVPVINGIGETPTLRADGRRLCLREFDKRSGLLIDFNGTEFPTIQIRLARSRPSWPWRCLSNCWLVFHLYPMTMQSPNIARPVQSLFRRS